MDSVVQSPCLSIPLSPFTEVLHINGPCRLKAHGPVAWSASAKSRTNGRAVRTAAGCLIGKEYHVQEAHSPQKDPKVKSRIQS